MQKDEEQGSFDDDENCIVEVDSDDCDESSSLNSATPIANTLEEIIDLHNKKLANIIKKHRIVSY